MRSNPSRITGKCPKSCVRPTLGHCPGKSSTPPQSASIAQASSSRSTNKTAEDTVKLYRSLYRALPKGSLLVVKPFANEPKYAHVLSQSPKRFNINRLGDIFMAWESALLANGAPFKKTDEHNFTITYPLSDNGATFKYRSDVYRQRSYRNGQQGIIHNLKLSNDGFLYKTAERLDTKTNIPLARHHNDDFFELRAATYRTSVGPIVDFAKRVLGLQKVKLLIYYSYEGERVDVKVFEPRFGVDGLIVTFEPGYPTTDDDDLLGAEEME